MFLRLATERQRGQTSETISDNADCYAGLKVRFESYVAVCNLLVQGPKVTYQDGFKFYCGVLR